MHDIGKNLVEIILSNNGYSVINLGIKVAAQELIAGYREHRPDIIGLSGLLVKSAQMMVETVQDFRTAGIAAPVLVGGAALSNRFTRLRIAPEYDGLVAYSPDAMSGLGTGQRDPGRRRARAADCKAGDGKRGAGAGDGSSGIGDGGERPVAAGLGGIAENRAWTPSREPSSRCSSRMDNARHRVPRLLRMDRIFNDVRRRVASVDSPRGMGDRD